MSNTIKVIDSEGQVLLECPIEEHERAHDYAVEMEKLGIEVTLNSPSVPESLAYSLGMTKEEGDVLHQSLIDEIDDHDVGCCFEKKEEEAKTVTESETNPDHKPIH